MAMPDDELLELLQGILTDIYEKVGATDWTKERQQRVVKAQIVELLRRFDVAIDELVPQMITEEYFKGVESAGAALVKEGVISSSAAAIDASGRITKEFRKPIYLDSLQTILEDTFLDLKAAIRTAEMSSITTIDSTIKKVKDEIAKGTITGNSRKVMQASVAKAFREDGMTAFITKDGKSLPLDFYAMTVTRTKTRTAGVEAASKRYEDNGQDLVQVDGNGDSCVICSRYRGMIFSLRGETEGYPVAGEGDYRLPIFHPNCRCTISPYVLSRKQQKEINEGKKRNAEFDPNDDRRTPAQRKAYEREQELRRKAREELKQFQRFNAALGADNFKTLGAFRKAKRENSPKFQELQSAYRSARMRNRVIKPKTPPVREAAAEVTTVRGITENAKKRFKEITDVKKPLDFSTNAKRRAYAKDVLEKSGLGELNLSVKKIKANGRVLYFKQKTASGEIRADVSDFQLLSDDARNQDYKKKTFFHELYHANYNGLNFDDELNMTWKTRTSWEETATESAAHYMSKEVGVTGMIVPSYMKDLMNNLPRLKKLDEFKDCVTIEDFGEVFMKYRFDDDYKTGKWEWLNKSVAESSEAVAHEVFSYNAQHYHKYIEDNFDEAVREAAASMKEFHRENKRYHKIIREHFDKSIKTKSNSVGYDTLIGWAMKKLGVK